MYRRYIAKVIITLCTIDIVAFPIIAIQFMELEHFILTVCGALVVHYFAMYIVYQIINDLNE